MKVFWTRDDPRLIWSQFEASQVSQKKKISIFLAGRHAVAGVSRAYPSAPGPIWDPLRKSRGTWPSASCPRVGRIVIEFGLVRRFPGYRVSGTSKGYQPRLTVPWVGTERSKRLGNRVTPEMGGGSKRWILGRRILISSPMSTARSHSLRYGTYQ